MPNANYACRDQPDWNVLTSPWLEVMNLNAESKVYSPLQALKRASEIRCIAAASPLDEFAAIRFLLTLLYWKAALGGGVQAIRESLLKDEMPLAVLEAIEADASKFRTFDDKAPFLQDPTAREGEEKSAGSLFAEFASGTNLAHFHHGHDENMRLCANCAIVGMLRLVPWTQSGGAGLSPSLNGAPPIVALALGANLAITLGLNLVPLAGGEGLVKWTGRFVPTTSNAAIPYLEAFTWNPRRVHLGTPRDENPCWRCGRMQVAAVGPIVYLKNEATKKSSEKQPFIWQDPAAFYAAAVQYKTAKSTKEERSAEGNDLARLLDQKRTPIAAVVAANPNHEGWRLMVPCTDGKAKTYDHRVLDLPTLLPDAIRDVLPVDGPKAEPTGRDGWLDPRSATRFDGASAFVWAAARLLAQADWSALANAAYKAMHESPAAFDILSGLHWSLRGKVSGLPSRNVAWLVLKLMAIVPHRARVPHMRASFCPLRSLPKRQLDERRKERPVRSPYPVSLPRGHRLEGDLRLALDKNSRKRVPEKIDWAGLCHSLDQLLD